MNTYHYPSFFTPLSIFATRWRLPAVLPPLATLVCGLFLTVATTRAQSAIPPDITPQVISIGSNLVVYGRAQMIIPQGGKHVRQVAVYIPALFNGTPSVTATVYSPQSPGTMFSLYNIQINDLGAQTQVAFSAANVQIGVPSDYTFVCDYVVSGIKR